MSSSRPNTNIAFVLSMPACKLQTYYVLDSSCVYIEARANHAKVLQIEQVLSIIDLIGSSGLGGMGVTDIQSRRS